MGAVSQAIHPKDQMFTGSIDRYLSVGLDALNRIESILAIYGTTPQRILDLGCGCGRVARHLRAAYPSAELVVADLMPHAVEFCTSEFGAVAGVAARDFSSTDYEHGFDLIWSGSVMTHLPEEAASDMFAFMARSLVPDGVAIWTTHGRHIDHIYRTGTWPYKLSAERLGEIVAAFREGRYAYSDYDHMTGYGISMTPIGWLADEAQRFDDIRILSVIERGWDEHQDVVAIRKASIQKR